MMKEYLPRMAYVKHYCNTLQDGPKVGEVKNCVRGTQNNSSSMAYYSKFYEQKYFFHRSKSCQGKMDLECPF